MPITWRNIEAPDFSAAQAGFQNFSTLLDRAFTGASQGLQRFDGEQDKLANNNFAMRLLQFSDPEAYAKAQTDGSLFQGVPIDRLSAASLAAAGARENDLLETKNNALRLDRGSFEFNRDKDTFAKLDAAAPLLPGAYSAAREGQTQFDAYLKAHPELTNLPYTQAGDLARSAIDTEKSGVEITGSRKTQKQNDWRFTNEQEEFVANKQFETTLAQLNQLGDPEAAVQSLNKLYGEGKVDPRVYNRLLAQYTGGAAGGGMPAAGAAALGAAAGGGGDPTRVMNYEARAAGFGSMPENVKTMGDASDFAITVNRAGVASSAMGTYQIVGQTLRGKNNQNGYGERALGPNWRSMPWNQENQDKVAEAIFNDNRGSSDALRKQWVSLSPTEAEQVRKMPWAQARQVIARKESGGDPAALALGNAMVGNAAATAGMERNAGQIYTAYAESVKDNRQIGEVSAQALKDKTFGDMSQPEIAKNIQSVQAAAKARGVVINAAVARDMLSSSITGQDTWFGFGTPKMGIDKDKLDSVITDYATGGQQRAFAAETNSGIGLAAQNAAKGNYETATARYQKAIRDRGLGFAVPNFDKIENDYRTASAAYDAAQKGNAANPGITSWTPGGKPGGPAQLAPAPSKPNAPKGLHDPMNPHLGPAAIIANGFEAGRKYKIPRQNGENDEKYAIRATNTARAIERSQRDAALARSSGASQQRRESYFAR